MNYKDITKLVDIACEQKQYTCEMTFEEMQNKQREYNKKNGLKDLSLEEINQYIKEARNGKA